MEDPSAAESLFKNYCNSSEPSHCASRNALLRAPCARPSHSRNPVAEPDRIHRYWSGVHSIGFRNGPVPIWAASEPATGCRKIRLVGSRSWATGGSRDSGADHFEDQGIDVRELNPGARVAFEADWIANQSVPYFSQDGLVSRMTPSPSVNWTRLLASVWMQM